jgi:hypothetical protein
MTEPFKIEGRADTDEQKRECINKILEVWLKHPHLRLSQLLLNANHSNTMFFYREDLHLVQDVIDFDTEQRNRGFT